MKKFLVLLLGYLITTFNVNNIDDLNELYDNYINETIIEEAPNNIILDLDFSTDVDDAVAVRVSDILAKQGNCNIKAIGLCTVDPLGQDRNIKCIDAILDVDGMENVAIGKSSKNDIEGSRYWDAINWSDGNYVAIDAKELYKQILRDNDNVTIITTGYLNNIQALLEDEEGFNLVATKCNKIVITGGDWQRGSDHNFNGTEIAKESSHYVDRNAPCKLVYVPNDIGGDFCVGAYLQKNHPDDIISKALYSWGSDGWGRTAWDPIVCYIGIMYDNIDDDFEKLYCQSWVGDGNNEFTLVDYETNRIVIRRTKPASYYESLLEQLMVY